MPGNTREMPQTGWPSAHHAMPVCADLESLKCIQAYLFNTSRTSTDKKNHFDLSSMSQTEEKLLVRIHTLMTGQIVLVMLLAIISAKIYRLFSAQTVIIIIMLYYNNTDTFVD